MHYIFYDLETTGLETDTDDIIQIAAVKMNDKFEFVEEFESYINPHKEISAKIVELTGITNELLKDKPGIEEVRTKFREFCNSDKDVTFVGYNNKNFDDKFAVRLLGIKGKTIDALEITRQLVPSDEVENYKLATICDYMGVSEDGNFHNALTDVRCTAKLFTILLRLLKETPKVSENFFIKRISYWTGFKGRSRVYVTTDYGTVFYEIIRGCWGNKNCSVLLSYKKLEEKIKELTNCSVRDFKGEVDFV